MVPVDTLAIVIAYGLDRTIEELPTRVHPVAIHGRLYAVVDRDWSAPRLIGVLIAVVFPLLPAIIAYSVTTLAVGLHWVAGALVAGSILFSVTSLHRLVTTATDIATATKTDIARAIQKLPALVGRTPDELTVSEIHSAVIESIAENLSDGLVAPLLGFVLLSFWSVPVGIGAAVWVKSVNTGDSMLGYHANPHGAASARLDDIVMWFPARVTAVLLCITAKRPRLLLTANQWQSAFESPNAGWPMSVIAAHLGVRLRKPDAYTINRSHELPTLEDVYSGIHSVRVSGLLTFVVAGGLTWL